MWQIDYSKHFSKQILGIAGFFTLKLKNSYQTASNPVILQFRIPLKEPVQGDRDGIPISHPCHYTAGRTVAPVDIQTTIPTGGTVVPVETQSIILTGGTMVPVCASGLRQKKQIHVLFIISQINTDICGNKSKE